jgi:hypothetical protein
MNTGEPRRNGSSHMLETSGAATAGEAGSPGYQQPTVDGGGEKSDGGMGAQITAAQVGDRIRSVSSNRWSGFRTASIPPGLRIARRRCPGSNVFRCHGGCKPPKHPLTARSHSPGVIPRSDPRRASIHANHKSAAKDAKMASSQHDSRTPTRHTRSTRWLYGTANRVPFEIEVTLSELKVNYVTRRAGPCNPTLRRPSRAARALRLSRATRRTSPTTPRSPNAPASRPSSPSARPAHRR